jgi:hypothetical protein
MRGNRFAVAALVLVVSQLFAGLGLAAAPAGKKFVQLGWDMPTTQYLRANWREMDETALFDGVIYQAAIQRDGKDVGTSSMWEATPWQREWFASVVQDLKTCAFNQLTDNFLRLNCSPGTLDWFDDAGWAALVNKIAIAGWIVRDGRQKGVCFDFESYGEPQFRFQPARGKPFAEAAAMARERGAQVMGALASECPDATILTLWLNSANVSAGKLSDPMAGLAGENYGLLAPFVDGMIAAMPSTMTMVDGCESAYLYDSSEAYLMAYNTIRQTDGPCARLVSPENRPKYRAQVQAGFGFYLDAYVNADTSYWYIGGGDGSRLERLQRNLTYAREVCDQYVWVYGEQCRWWPRSYADPASSAGQMWENAVPGITQAIRWAKDPVAAARHAIESGALVNLLANASFSEGASADGALPVRWGAWQDEKTSGGTFALDREVGRSAAGSARMSGVASGCFIQNLEVKPGDRYAVRAHVHSVGSGVATVTVRWQDANGRWMAWDRDSTSVFGPVVDGWSETTNAVQVPEGVGRLVLLLSVSSQVSEADQCWYDDVAVYRLGY